MLNVVGNDIFLTRGDTARFTVTLVNMCDDKIYTPSPDDVFRFTVKKDVYDEKFVFQKISQGNPVFHITPEDTKTLDFRKYVYDIELTTNAGDVYTVVEYSDFNVTKEVT